MARRDGCAPTSSGPPAARTTAPTRQDRVTVSTRTDTGVPNAHSRPDESRVNPVWIVGAGALVATWFLYFAGGGLRAGSSANIIGGRFERNTSFNAGGAMRATGALTLTNVTVISNVVTNAGQDGGGISALGGLFMQGTLLQNNLAPNSGGGINANAATITASNIISNAANNGGGIFVTSAASGLVINNATFVQNKAVAGDGGSIYASGPITLGGSFISMTVVNQSMAMTNGGGIYAASGVFLRGVVEFHGNNAQNGEGGAQTWRGGFDRCACRQDRHGW